MDLNLTDEEREIREWVRTFVRKEIIPLEPEVLARERRNERGLKRTRSSKPFRTRRSSPASSGCTPPRSTAGWGSAR